MSITPTKLSNPCGVCGDDTGKCRQGKQDAEYFQCMTYVDTKKGEIENGFKCIGHAGLWTQFKPDNSQIWTEQQRIERKAENEQRRRMQAIVKDEWRRHCLPVEARDKAIRALHSHFGLSDAHRSDLKARGLSDEAIARNLYFSIKPNAELPQGIPYNLPGTSNGQILAGGKGYACPTFDPTGKATGWQIRIDKATENKYRWAKDCHLHNGELPVSSFYPVEVQRSGIWISEGVLKPAIASERMGAIFIGAAGGNFASSPLHTADALRVASEWLGTKEIIFAPDAGSIRNEHVLRTCKRSWVLFERLGYKVKVAWWGQIDKTDPDIDELQDYSEIQFLAPETFLEMGHPSEDEDIFEFGTDASPQFPDIPRFDWWWKNRGLSGATQVNQRYVDLPLPKDGTITFIKSGTGTGKTTLMKKWVGEWRRTYDCSFLIPGYRNSLLEQISENLGVRHIIRPETRILASEPGSGVAFCIQSMLKIDSLVGQDYSDKIIFIDECMSVVRDLLAGSTVKNRTETIAKFKRILSGARLVICMDATLADWCVDFLSKCAPNKKVVKFESTFKGNKPRLNFLIGTFAEDASKVKKNDRSPYFRQMLEASLPAICSDSQIFLEGVEKLLIESGKRVLRVDSKTIGDEGTKEFLKNCDAYIKKYKPDVLLYSPSAESGLDISIKGYFTHHFGFFFGVQGTDAIIQMMGRIRDAKCEKYVWIKEYGNLGENAVVKSIKDLYLSDLSTALSPEKSIDLIIEKLETLKTKSEENFATNTAICINEIANFEKTNLRTCTREAFVEAGYKVINCILEGSATHTEREKEVKEEVKQEVSELIFNAEQIPVHGEKDWKLLEDLKRSEKLEDRWKVENAKLRKRLPGIEKSDVWTAGLIYLTKFNDRDFISHCENYWLLENPEIAKALQAKNLAYLSQKDSIFLPDYKSQWATIHALKELGIEKFLSVEAEWHENSPEVNELVKAAPKYSNALGCKPTTEKGRGIKFLARLLDKVGVKLKCERRRVGTKNLRFYRIDPAYQVDPFRVAALQSITQKWDAESAKNEAENAVEMAIEVLSKKQPETHTGQGVEGVPLVANNVYILESNGTDICEESQIDRDTAMGGEVGQNDVLTPAEELAELLLEFADSYEMFHALVEREPSNIVNAAIIAAPTAWVRRQWAVFYEQFLAPQLEAEREAELAAFGEF